MALNKSLTGAAFGILNEFLSILHDDGYARPSRFEVVIKPPKRIAGTAAAAQMNNPAPFQLDEFAADKWLIVLLILETLQQNFKW